MSEINQGAQRLSLQSLKRWSQQQFGMFIHFGMSTFDGKELSDGNLPSTAYAPSELDVDQWIAVARDAGMTYAVLTAKHVSGHALWPSRHTNYHVGTSSNKTNIVEAFVAACHKYGVRPGLYYCSWDNHHTYGSVTPSHGPFHSAFTTQAYRDFQAAQIEELLTQFGPIYEVWIDIPRVLGHDGRRKQYEQIVALQPDAYIMMNHGIGDGSSFNYDYAWPTDLMAIERFLPNSDRGYKPWHLIKPSAGDAQNYYIPAEVCDPIGYDWFFTPTDTPRSDGELLGMRLICEARNCNLLLNVPPDTSGKIGKLYIDALNRLRVNYERTR